MPIGLGLGLQFAGGAPVAAVPSPNPNHLLWSEELDQAATWIAVSAVVTANQGQDESGNATADQVAFGVNGRILQVTGIAVTAGGPYTASFIPDATRTRFQLTGAFDGVDYIFSGYHEDPTVSGLEVGVTMQRTGGFIEVRVRDTGDTPTVLLSQMKLETPDLTAYVKREGT